MHELNKREITAAHDAALCPMQRASKKGQGWENATWRCVELTRDLPTESMSLFDFSLRRSRACTPITAASVTWEIVGRIRSSTSISDFW